jgi:hypothetical protein
MTARSSILDIFSVDTSETGVLRTFAAAMLPYHTYITPGSGEILEIRFQISESASPGFIDLTFEDSGFHTYENSLTDTASNLIIPVLSDGYLQVFGTTYADEEMSLPEDGLLLTNFPNPFNSSTLISFNLPAYGPARLEIYDILGQQVKTMILGNLTAGAHSVSWNGRNQYDKEVSSGVFCYALFYDQMSVLSNKMVLLK